MIDINFLARITFIGVATSRYITNDCAYDLFAKFITAPFAFDVHSTTEKATEGEFI